MRKAHSLLGKALGLRAGEVLTVLEQGGEIVVMRGGGEANESVREAVLNGVAYNPDMSRWQLRPGASIARTGAQVRIRL